jgi:hypothetical protein
MKKIMLSMLSMMFIFPCFSLAADIKVTGKKLLFAVPAADEKQHVVCELDTDSALSYQDDKAVTEKYNGKCYLHNNEKGQVAVSQQAIQFTQSSQNEPTRFVAEMKLPRTLTQQVTCKLAGNISKEPRNIGWSSARFDVDGVSYQCGGEDKGTSASAKEVKKLLKKAPMFTVLFQK